MCIIIAPSFGDGFNHICCKMRTTVLVGVLLSSLLCTYGAQLDCCALGFGDIQPTNGNDSSVCLSNAEDCCTSTYLGIINGTVRSQLNEYLHNEYRYGIDYALSKVNDLVDYFSEHVLERDIIHALVATSNSKITNESVINLTNMLSDGLKDPMVCEKIRNKFAWLLGNITETYYTEEELSKESKDCISRIIISKIDNDSLAQIASGLVRLYSYTLRAVQKIRSFIESQTNRTEGASFSTACVNGFIETAFCRQCVERTPPICVLTCNALVRGCYSPYYTLLNGQFQELWAEIKRLSVDVNSTVHSVLCNSTKLVELSKLQSDIQRGCGLETKGDGDTSKERTTVGIPLSVLEPLMTLTGPFLYDSDERDLKICREKTDENACFEVTQGPQGLGCTPMDEAQLMNSTYTSNPGKISTSECDCFDGIEFTSDDETMQTFDGNDIHNQGGNPVFQPPLNVGELEIEQMELENQQGNPVRDFLSSKDYTELLQPQESQSGKVCSEIVDPTSTSVQTAASLTALSLALLVACCAT